MYCDQFKAIDQRIKGKSSFVILYFRCLYEFAMTTYAGYFFTVKHLQKMTACSLILFSVIIFWIRILTSTYEVVKHMKNGSQDWKSFL